MWAGGASGNPTARKQVQLGLLCEWVGRGFWQHLEMLKAGMCAELAEHSAWQWITLPISLRAHTRQHRNSKKGKHDETCKSRESLLRCVQKPQSYHKPYTTCARGLKTTTKLIQFLQGWPKLETSLKTMRHLKLLPCPSPSPENSLRSLLGSTPGEIQLLGWVEVCTSRIPLWPLSFLAGVSSQVAEFSAPQTGWNNPTSGFRRY